MTYTKGDIFLDKYTHKLYFFDGEVWQELILTTRVARIDKI